MSTTLYPQATRTYTHTELGLHCMLGNIAEISFVRHKHLARGHVSACYDVVLTTVYPTELLSVSRGGGGQNFGNIKNKYVQP